MSIETPEVSSLEKRVVNLRGASCAELEELAAEGGFGRFRGKQLYHWLFKKGARSFDEMANLPKDFRAWLAENHRLGGVVDNSHVLASNDGSYKFLFELEDGKRIEAVLMPDPKREYWTLCVSSQVGCAVDCKFCVTGFNGFFRNLRIDEIVDQVLFARRHLENEKRVRGEEVPPGMLRNVVFMGMGEPLLNPDNVIAAIRLLIDVEGICLSPRRVTVSTSGIVPGMIQLAESGVDVCLALSLNASSHDERSKIMPITKKYPLEEVLNVCRKYRFGKHKRITMEYVLLAGFNDGPEQANRLVKMLKSIPCKVNLIPWNPSSLLPFERPERESIDRFAKILLDNNYTVSVRWSKALDVDGACGQLAGDQKRKRPGSATVVK